MCLLRAVQKTVSAEQYVINIIRSLNAASKGAWEGKYKINNVLWAARNSAEAEKVGEQRSLSVDVRGWSLRT